MFCFTVCSNLLRQFFFDFKIKCRNHCFVFVFFSFLFLGIKRGIMAEQNTLNRWCWWWWCPHQWKRSFTCIRTYKSIIMLLSSTSYISYHLPYHWYTLHNNIKYDSIAQLLLSLKNTQSQTTAQHNTTIKRRQSYLIPQHGLSTCLMIFKDRQICDEVHPKLEQTNPRHRCDKNKIFCLTHRRIDHFWCVNQSWKYEVKEEKK